jgi:hypothetical protein
MILIPKQLQKKEYRFCLIKKSSKIPFETGWGEKANYSFNDKKLLTHLNNGGNYGVIGGFGNLAGIDADAFTIQEKIEARLPETLTILSGGTNENNPEHPEKKHYYYEITDGLQKTMAIKKEKENLGHIRWTGGQLVGANSLHESGNTYKIIKDLPIAKITSQELYETIGEYLDLINTKKEEIQKEETKIKIEEIIDINTLTSRNNGKFQGKHPFHDSKTKWDFEADINKQNWFCFSHWTGGGALELLAIKEKIISCDKIQKGWLKKHFKEMQQICKEKYGFSLKQKEELLPDVPTKTLIDLSSFQPIFENTHQHLPQFKKIDSDLGLKGEEYYPLKKAICYHVESIRQPVTPFLMGTKPLGDNRPHYLVMLTGGAGKGQIKDIGRKYNGNEYKRTIEISANRLNLEQLIGKMKEYEKTEVNEYTGKKEKVKYTKTILGYFGYDVLQIDECTELLCETQTMHTTTMEEIRKAMDIYGKNWVEKKLVDNESALTYKPPTRFFFFAHDCILPAVFFDKGTFRRLFTFNVTAPKVKETASIDIFFEENYSKELDYYINTKTTTNEIEVKLTKKAIEEIQLWILTWNRWVLLHPNSRIRAVAHRWFFSIRESFLKNILVLGIYYLAEPETKKIEIDENIVKIACFDTIHFLLKTYEVYGNKSNVGFSRDIWKTSDQRKARFLEWLHYNNATSLETSKINVGQAVDKIATDIFGVTDRQAKAILQEMAETEGLINKQQDGEYKKIWLAFTPALEGNIEFETKEQPKLEEFLEKQKLEIEKSICFGGSLFSTIQKLLKKPINEFGV